MSKKVFILNESQIRILLSNQLELERLKNGSYQSSEVRNYFNLFNSSEIDSQKIEERLNAFSTVPVLENESILEEIYSEIKKENLEVDLQDLKYSDFEFLLNQFNTNNNYPKLHSLLSVFFNLAWKLYEQAEENDKINENLYISLFLLYKSRKNAILTLTNKESNSLEKELTDKEIHNNDKKETIKRQYNNLRLQPLSRTPVKIIFLT